MHSVVSNYRCWIIGSRVRAQPRAAFSDAIVCYSCGDPRLSPGTRVAHVHAGRPRFTHRHRVARLRAPSSPSSCEELRHRGRRCALSTQGARKAKWLAACILDLELCMGLQHGLGVRACDDSAYGTAARTVSPDITDSDDSVTAGVCLSPCVSVSTEKFRFTSASCWRPRGARDRGWTRLIWKPP